MSEDTRQERRAAKLDARRGRMRVHGKRYVTVVQQVIAKKAQEARREGD